MIVRRWGWVVLAGMLAAVIPAEAAKSFSVRMDVTAEQDVKSKVEIGFARVFRSIPDVKVVEAEDDWVISAVLAPIRVNKGPIIAYAFSTFVGTSEQNRALVKSLSYYFKDADTKSKFEDLVSNNYVIISHKVQVVSPADLEKVAGDVIRDFNMDVLQQQRSTK